MKNSFGSAVTVTLLGESHGAEIGAVLDGVAPGIRVDPERIASLLSLRRGEDGLSTGRREADDFRIVSGEYKGLTTGAPLTVLISNADIHAGDYPERLDIPRPSHADYTCEVKYHGFGDCRGGGHFSGRLTAPLVALGAVALTALEEKGIRIGTHLWCVDGMYDRPFGDTEADCKALSERVFPVLDKGAGEKMREVIRSVREAHDSVGGILETAVTGLPAGVGEPWFDTVEGTLSHAIFSIPAVKGVEFGMGFGLAGKGVRGSNANDAFALEAGSVVTKTNHSGGILGGISNGMPLVFRTVIKPTPSIGLPQASVSLVSGENTTLTVGGRHDPCIAPRARAAVDALTALTLLDLLTLRYGEEYFVCKRDE